jgi:GT2 family glycosyltransferase
MTTCVPVYVIVLTWNRCVDTLECLASLARSIYPAVHVLIVDNGSSDGTPEAVRSAFPQAEIIELHSNGGFAAGVNVGLRHAWASGADFALLLNNDTLVDPGMLSALMQYVAPHVALLAPVVYYAGRPAIIQAAGGARHRWTLEQIEDARDCPRPVGWPETIERDFLPGTAMLIARTAFGRIGPFDERFFMYYEDNDFCLRARQLGFRLLLVTQAALWHKGSASSGGMDSPARRYAMARGSVQFFRKHVRGTRWLVVGPYRLGSALKTTGRLLAQRRGAATLAYWRGLRDGFRV